MRVHYADSSVLVKRHVVETGSSWFRDVVEHQHENMIVSSQISVVEVCSAFARRTREANLTQDEFQWKTAEFDHVCTTEYRMIPVSDSVVERAKHLLATRPLKAYDSIQLASAVLVGDRLTGTEDVEYAFLAADQRLLDAASAEGLRTLDPNSVDSRRQ